MYGSSPPSSRTTGSGMVSGSSGHSASFGLSSGQVLPTSYGRLEIDIDGLIGTHRVFAFMGAFYNFLIGSFEILAFLVLIAVFLFWTRRNIVRLKRFFSPETVGWPTFDANNILYFEVVLMFLFSIFFCFLLNFFRIFLV